MPRGRFNGVTYYEIDVDAAPNGSGYQNWTGNYSDFYWRVIVYRLGGTSGWYSGPNSNSYGGADTGLGGQYDLWYGSNLSYDFRPGVGHGITFASGVFRVPHNADGYAWYWMNGWMNLHNLGYAFAETGTREVARIPKRPATPGNPVITEILPTSMKVSWSGSSDNRGSAISGYLLRMWPNAAGRGNYIDHSFENNLSRTVTGLTPGQEYRFQVFARNSAADNNGYSNGTGGTVARTLSGAWLKSGGTWRRAIPYTKVGGLWKLSSPFIKSGGTWRRGG